MRTMQIIVYCNEAKSVDFFIYYLFTHSYMKYESRYFVKNTFECIYGKRKS